MSGAHEAAVAPEAGARWQRLRDALPAPADRVEQDDVLWQQLVAEFAWYDRAATRNRYGHQGLRLTTLVVGAAVTVLAATDAPRAVTASLAALIVVLEGAQQLFQFHANWICYRATAEALREHAFLYVARAAPYADARNRREVLAAALRDVTTKENAAWSTTMRQDVGRLPAPGP